MDIISLDKVDNLIWLGRYSERVYITIKEFFTSYDKMIEHPDFYVEYCNNFQIPNIYEDMNDFVCRYVKDRTDQNSIIANMDRAYDNCIVLRNELGTQTMSYLELALNELSEIKDFDSFIIDLQDVLDHILAFWACLDDDVENYEVRNLIKFGKRLERFDIYLRLRKPKKDLKKACEMLEHRLSKINIPYDREAFLRVREMINNGSDINYDKAVALVESLVN